jgi:YVTN family beta-propeller protein
VVLVLLGTSACGGANQSSSDIQTTASPVANATDDDASPTTDATPDTQVTPGITPTTTHASKPAATSTSKIKSVAAATPTPKHEPASTPHPTPTPSASALVYQQVGVMAVKSANKGSWDFDISWVDQPGNKYYLADRDSKGIDVFDLNTRKFVTTITGFAGPNGVLADNQGQLWVGDSDSTVKAVNTQTNKVIATISTGGKGVTDEIAYDPQDQLIIAGNGDDSTPFVTIISVTGHRVVKKVSITGAEGLEQPVWDAQAHLFYISVPKTAKDPGGAIAVIDPQAGSIRNIVPLTNCAPTGFAIGPNHQAMIGCDGHPVIMDLTSWKVLATISQTNGCDEVWYNAGDQRYYLAADGNNAGPSLSVIDARTLQFIQNVPTKSGSHSVAAATGSNIVLLPMVGTGIAIYAAH